MKKTCLICDTAFNTTGNGRYCSPGCAQAGKLALQKRKALANIETRQCVVCQAHYNINIGSKKIYCSDRCRDRVNYMRSRRCRDRTQLEQIKDSLHPQVVGSYYQEAWTIPARTMSGVEAEMMNNTPSQCHKCKHMETCRDIVSRLQVDRFYNGEIRCMVR